MLFLSWCGGVVSHHVPMLAMFARVSAGVISVFQYNWWSLVQDLAGRKVRSRS